MNRLSAVEPGNYVRIERIDDEEFALKFLELGLCPGKMIEVVRKAPSGNPVAVKIGRSIFAMRLEEADHILVESEVK